MRKQHPNNLLKEENVVTKVLLRKVPGRDQSIT